MGNRQTILLFLALSSTAYGQVKTIQNSTSTIPMDTLSITNEKVRSAIGALQENNLTAWYSFFTENPVFTDDGRTLNFRSFFDNAFAHKEKFLTIDKVENNGKDIYGNFKAGQWGTFNVFFKFHQNAQGKFDRLDIGQTAK